MPESSPLPPSSPRGSRRETRLLLLTLVVSVAVLLLLARFRFPDRQPLPALSSLSSTPDPLARMAGTGMFADMRATLTDLLQRLQLSVVVLRLTPDAPLPQIGLAADTLTGQPRLVPALRFREDLAVTLSSGRARAEVLEAGEVFDASLHAHDPSRALSVYRVPGRAMPALTVQSQANLLTTPDYFAFVEAGVGGPTLRAAFASRLDPVPDSTWNASLLAVGGLPPLPAGTLMFTLSGRLAGLVSAQQDVATIVPGETLLQAAEQLPPRAAGSSAADAGIDVQALSPALAKAASADRGVIVRHVDPAGPAARRVEVGDVITAVDADPVDAVARWLQALARRTPSTTVTLQVRRGGKVIAVPLTLAGADRALPAPSTSTSAHTGTTPPWATQPGLTLRAVNGSLDVVRVAPGSPAASAGIQPGDVITALPGRGALSNTRVAAAYQGLSSGQAMLVALERAGQPLLVSVEKP